MKKITKLSLIATLALGSVSFANAQALEEAIKNVDVSGTVTYRYNDYEENDNVNDSKSENIFKAAINLKSKVNDDVVANVRFIVGEAEGADASYINTQSQSDKQLDVTLSEVNFTYTGIANTAITFGKQGLATPFTVHRDSIGNEQTGTGIVAVTNVGPVTLAAAYFNNTNLNKSKEVSLDIKGHENVLFAGAMASFAGINADASYIELEDFFDAYTVGLSASYDVASVKLNPYARYSSLDLDNNSADNVLWKVGMRANMGIFGAHLGYGQTDKEGGVVALDASSETGYDEHWRVTLSGETDSSVIYASVDAQVLPSLNVALKYSDLDDDKKENKDQKEIYTQVTYQMSKNFTGYVRFGQYEVKNKFNGGTKDLDSTIGRLHVQYSF
ncbi:porin [Malaciobacter mytili]|uniref:porin n=1 Tax=Malaciobacter mytili TaxID=603050 RepID=UPI003BAE9DE5